MRHHSRNYVLHEATYPQLRSLEPNVAVLPWGATEAHGHHLPYGTDNVEATALGERAVAAANDQGARCVLLPCVPFGIDHSQLNQVATITMRGSTQHAVLRDVAESLTSQGIDRLVLLNFHGGNEFKTMIRDIMFDLPIYIVQVHGHRLVPRSELPLDEPAGDHADEFETSLMMHLTPDWVDEAKNENGPTRASELPALANTPGVWASRHWPAYTVSTGAGDARQATAAKGEQVLRQLAAALTPVLVELSQATHGDFPFVLADHHRPADSST